MIEVGALAAGLGLAWWASRRTERLVGVPPPRPGPGLPLGRLRTTATGAIERLTAGRRAAEVDARQRRDVPTVAHLLAMVLASGGNVDQALRVAAQAAPPSLSPALAEAVAAVDLGAGVAAAVGRMRRVAPAAAGLCDALEASADLGVAAASSLVARADDARAQWLRQAQARARVVPVRLLFPLVFLVLPAFALLGVAPSLLAGLSG